MATLLKRGSRWYVIFVDASGKRRWKAGYTDKGETQRLANRMEEEARAIRRGDVDPQVEARRAERSKPITIHLANYRAKLQAAGRSDGHIHYTIGDIESLIAFAAGVGNSIKSASEITVPLIDRWVLRQRQQQDAGERGHANKTINRRVASVQQFLKYLTEVGGVGQYVLKRYPKLPTGEAHRTRRSRALTNVEAGKLMTLAKEDRRDLYAFALRTGLRMNECRQMVPAYVDFDNGIITIPAHVAKAKRDQAIPLHAGLVEMLTTRGESRSPDEPLFTIPVQKCVNRNLRSDCRRAGIDPKDVSFHSLRHTFATLLARANVHPALLQKLARHADLSTTLKYYVHLQRADEAQAINKLD